MPEPEDNLELDIDNELRGLFHQAEQVTRAAAAQRVPEAAHARPVAPSHTAHSEPAREVHADGPVPGSLSHMLRPVLLGLQALTRASGENHMLLEKLTRAAELTGKDERELSSLASEFRVVLDQKNGLNQRMFDALHEELKGYKDGFLLESVHRPIIRDLLSIFDEVSEVHRQMAGFGDEPRLANLAINVGHNIEFILEVLARLEVIPMLAGTGKLDKLTQRAVALEVTDDRDQDSMIVRSVKPGFFWKGRVLRPEDVIAKRWRGAPVVAQEPAAPAPLSE